MTGFGRVARTCEGREIVAELRSVNHRFLDLNFRIPRSLGFLEDALRKRIGSRLSRGHVDLFLSYRNLRRDAREVALDEALIGAYKAVFDDAARQSGLTNDLALSHLIAMPDVLSVRESEEDRDAVTALALSALDGALDELTAARLAEGARLRDDLAARFQTMAGHLNIIEAGAGNIAQQMKERVEKRVAELLQGADLDPARGAQEAAILADRAAIDEEIVRLHSHLRAAAETLRSAEPAGRPFDFLVQEMHREVNTIGSKAADLAITNRVLLLKAEIEKIREQVQNIE